MANLPKNGATGKTVLLKHATLLKYLPSIQRHGLLTSKSRGKLKAVWLHSASRSSWASLHTVKRHGSTIEQVATIELRVPRRWLRRSAKGLWYSLDDIPTDCFRRFIRFEELAASPVAR